MSGNPYISYVSEAVMQILYDFRDKQTKKKKKNHLIWVQTDWTEQAYDDLPSRSSSSTSISFCVCLVHAKKNKEERLTLGT